MKQNPKISFLSHLVPRYVKNPAYTIYSLFYLSVLGGASQSCQILFEVAVKIIYSLPFSMKVSNFEIPKLAL